MITLIIAASLMVLFIVIGLSILWAEETMCKEDIKNLDWDMEQTCIQWIRLDAKKYPEMIKTMGIHFNSATAIGFALVKFLDRQGELFNRWHEMLESRHPEKVQLVEMEMKILKPNLDRFLRKNCAKAIA